MISLETPETMAFPRQTHSLSGSATEPGATLGARWKLLCYTVSLQASAHPPRGRVSLGVLRRTRGCHRAAARVSVTEKLGAGASGAAAFNSTREVCKHSIELNI